MTYQISEIRKEAVRLLQEDVVDVVVGFEAGTLPTKCKPTQAKSAEDAQELVLNGFCQNNLAAFLKDVPKGQRAGIVCRGCESRAIQALIVEKQYERENLYIIGVPCTGILDLQKIQREFGENILGAVEEGDQVTITTKAESFTLDRKDYLHHSCASCLHPNPTGENILIGEPVPENDPEIGTQRIAEFENLSDEERYEFFLSETDRCIRCYACREACPMCYCSECFVDHTTPRWAESMITTGGKQAWHIIRAFHQTGRCVSCGACERACPMDIKMTYLTDKLNMDVKNQFGFEVGLNETDQPPLTTFTLDDKNRFVR